ncbi:Uma2 family endonuclease [Nostoc sp. UHCC 0252]|uniref:Uma2 family endonuclease n=1 Tax=Nostoc sp. UHCC 0252 TaxID=3110241 RepID=UPI002B220C6D|nr:Uma2 family endonuclease [Nostoc sp. UHCC 0252]MEA5606047.1 Uma2 family endonuclease [Nostoc sp. UHCC 0252]
MIQALRKVVTFDEFVAKYPDNTGKRYELHDGVIVEMPQPTGDHEEIIVFLVQKFILEYSRIGLRYGIPKTVLVKPLESESAYSPDVLILNLPNLVNEPLWKKESTVSQAESIPLVVEVVSQCVARVPRVEATDEPVRVSSNWRDDYLKKAADYEAVGIPEYWIVDYAALGGRRFIGNPKQPTVSLYTLIEGEYQVSQFQGSDRIISPLFPESNLTPEQIFQAGGYPI